MKTTPSQPPPRLPVLTEVVQLPPKNPAAGAAGALADNTAYAATTPAPLSDWAPGGAAPAKAPPQQPVSPPDPLVSETALTQRVMMHLDRQLDLMFEQKLRETMAPVLARLTDAMVRELRNQLASSMREMVARAVAQELDRVRRG